ncbi:unnamed protein product [Choristocarpus tenellus]
MIRKRMVSLSRLCCFASLLTFLGYHCRAFVMAPNLRCLDPPTVNVPLVSRREELVRTGQSPRRPREKSPIMMGRGNAFRQEGGESKRQARVAQLIAVEVSSIIRRGHGIKTLDKLAEEVRLKISVVDVNITPDLRTARIYVSVYGDVFEKREAYAWCVKSAKSIRHVMASNLRNMKRVPELLFKQTDLGAAVDLMALIDRVSEEDAKVARAWGEEHLYDDEEDEYYFDMGDDIGGVQ